MSVFEVEDTNVDDLLAFIDEAYASEVRAGVHDARGHQPSHATRCLELGAQVEEMQRMLDAARRQCSGEDGIAITRWWGSVARRQREQREAAKEENTRLKSCVHRQQELARRAIAVLGELQSIQLYPTPRIRALAQFGSWSSIPPLFSRRLDEVCGCVASCGIQVTSSSAHHQDVKWNDAKTELCYKTRSTRLYPFKLSSVANEIWRAIYDHTSTRSLDHDENYHAAMRAQMRTPLGFLDVQGSVANRRVFTDDGKVMVVSVAVMVGTESVDNDNLMAGLEMHETVTVRLIRMVPSNPRSPVFVERMSESKVFAASGTCGSDHTWDIQARLQRLRNFFEAFTAKDRGEGRQKLENRLMEASLSPKVAEKSHHVPELA